jgi:hypothetical protein
MDFTHTNFLQNQQKPPLVGISRPKRHVVFAEAQEQPEQGLPTNH